MTTTPCCNHKPIGDKHCICPCHTSPTQEEWEKIFDGRFVNFYDEEEDEVDVRSRLKHFIRETRQLAYKEGYEAGKDSATHIDAVEVATKACEWGRQSVLTELLGALPEPITLGKDIKISIEAYAKSWNDAIDKVRQIITNRLTKEK